MGSWARTVARGGWRDTDVWLDPAELTWFGEIRKTVQSAVPGPPLLVGTDAGSLALGGARLGYAPAPATRIRRKRPVPSRARRLTTRLFPSVIALVAVTAGTPLVLAARAERSVAAPSTGATLTPVTVARPIEASLPAPGPLTTSSAETTPAPAVQAPTPVIRWRESRAIGLPYAGRLVDAVHLPAAGPGWVTWDPVLDRVPNRASRLYGTDALVRLVLGVIGEYRVGHPDAPPVVVGDLSRRRGGDIDEHVSHENGLDVDIYYPRLDGRARPPTRVAQIDFALAQDLLDRFLAAGVQVVFVGQHADLHGPSDRVVPYPEHDNHMHVRLATPPSGSGE